MNILADLSDKMMANVKLRVPVAFADLSKYHPVLSLIVLCCRS